MRHLVRARRLNRILLLLCSVSLLCSVLYTEDEAPRRMLTNCSREIKHNIHEAIDFTRMIVAQYPTNEKIATFQMEAMTGWEAKDDWDYEFMGMSDHPFIVTNYPHQEGVWSWGDTGDQVILVVRNIRTNIVEHNSMLWNLAKHQDMMKDKFGGSQKLLKQTYFEWRDKRIIRMIKEFGWFIDYWMEAGLMRDVETNQITTPQHWYMLLQPIQNSRDDLKYENFVESDTIVEPSYDPICSDRVSNGCYPVAVISSDNLLQRKTSQRETKKIAKSLEGKRGISDFLIKKDAFNCVWEEQKIKRSKKSYPGRDISFREYHFSEEMLFKMIDELNRLIKKYASSEWFWKATAKELVYLLTEQRLLIKKELKEVKSGNYKLKENDFLGPSTRRQKRRNDSTSKVPELNQVQQGSVDEYFRKLEDELFEKRMEQKKQESFASERDRMRQLVKVHTEKEIASFGAKLNYSKQYQDVKKEHELEQTRTLSRSNNTVEAENEEPDFTEYFRALEIESHERLRERKKLEAERRRYQIDQYLLAGQRMDTLRRLKKVKIEENDLPASFQKLAHELNERQLSIERAEQNEHKIQKEIALKRLHSRASTLHFWQEKLG